MNQMPQRPSASEIEAPARRLREQARESVPLRETPKETEAGPTSHVESGPATTETGKQVLGLSYSIYELAVVFGAGLVGLLLLISQFGLTNGIKKMILYSLDTTLSGRANWWLSVVVYLFETICFISGVGGESPNGPDMKIILGVWALCCAAWCLIGASLLVVVWFMQVLRLI